MLLLVLSGCAAFRELDRSWLTQNEKAVVIERARTLALASGLVQGTERAIVESGNPNMSYYFLSGVHYAQYFITWSFADKGGVLVSGEGSMLTLKGAMVKRLPAKPLRAMTAKPPTSA